MAKQRSKIKKYRKPLNINIGMVIFAVVFFYVVYGVISYFQTSRIVRYEVKEGSLAVNNICRGIVLRNETVVNTDSAGYINYFAYEGERVAVGDLVYTIDEAGRLNSYIETGAFSAASLSDKELREFRNEIVNFVHGFDEQQFGNTYDFKRSLKNTVLKIANVNMLKSIENMSDEAGGNVINYNRAHNTGIVAYWTDGYENLKAEDVTKAVFDEKEYEKKQILGNELIAAGEPAYKLSLDEEWSLVIPVDEERGRTLLEEEYIKVRFLSNQYESWGQVSLLHGSDGNTFLRLDFNNSMITFISDRFLDVELVTHDETGLKIPVSSIIEKEFFLIKKDFLITEGENGKSGVIRQCYLEDGTISSEFVSTDVYSYDEENEEYYLDASQLSAGNVLYKLDSQETYTVSRRATLIGVYNMNKGYADFKEINILYKNEEYAIVKANTRYGLNVYDYIVLDAAAVSDDQFINE
ncbi:MAG: hypothetical protein NC081_02475 [Roseburia sp.]|nr:hypothetical protein [Roseburia sp.]